MQNVLKRKGLKNTLSDFLQDCEAIMKLFTDKKSKVSKKSNEVQERHIPLSRKHKLDANGADMNTCDAEVTIKNTHKSKKADVNTCDAEVEVNNTHKSKKADVNTCDAEVEVNNIHKSKKADVNTCDAEVEVNNTHKSKKADVNTCDAEEEVDMNTQNANQADIEPMELDFVEYMLKDKDLLKVMEEIDELEGIDISSNFSEIMEQYEDTYDEDDNCSDIIPVLPLPQLDKTDTEAVLLLDQTNTETVPQLNERDDTGTVTQLDKTDTKTVPSLDNIITSLESEDEILNFEEKDILRDVNNQIFIRKVLKSNEQKTNQKKKGMRVYNSYHACFYCSKLFMHILPHLRKKHKIKKPAENNLRALGDDKHNNIVLEEKKGELLLSRRPKKDFKASDYGPCPHCKEWLLKTVIPRHQVKCKIKKTETKLTKKELIYQSDMMTGRYQSSASKGLQKVINNMRADDVGKIAQKDELILGLGETWFHRNVNNKYKRGNYTSGRMRLSAKLLMEMKKITENQSSLQSIEASSNLKENDKTTMWHFLTPVNFDIIAEAALKVAKPEDDDNMEELNAPSNAIKLGYDIMRMINIKLGISLRRSYERDIVNKCYDLLTLFRNEWNDKVKRKASSVLIDRALTKTGTSGLPSPDDVKKLTDHLTNALKNLKLNENADGFTRASNLLQARLLLYNKRRSGEIDCISLQNYANRSAEMNDIDKSMATGLSDFEKHILETQQLLMVRGKRSRPVPVIIPQDCNRILEWISSKNVREKAGIQSSNNYLFASKGSQPIRSYESLKKVAGELTLAHPELLTSVTMRKYTATLSQVWNLNENELQWLCSHLGHTKKVHLGHYRQMSGYIERVEISKLLMIEDLQKADIYKGKSLEDVSFEDIIGDTADSETDPTIDGGKHGKVKDSSSDGGNVNNFEFEDDTDATKTNTKRTSNRKKWSEEELKELKQYFGKHLINKTVPGKSEWTSVLKKSQKCNGALFLRTGPLIVKKISNMNKSKNNT